jgi:hypothetical protein
VPCDKTAGKSHCTHLRIENFLKQVIAEMSRDERARKRKSKKNGKKMAVIGKKINGGR